MVDSASELVHEKTTHSRLSIVARLLAIKSQHNMSIAEYDDIIGIIKDENGRTRSKNSSTVFYFYI